MKRLLNDSANLLHRPVESALALQTFALVSRLKAGSRPSKILPTGSSRPKADGRGASSYGVNVAGAVIEPSELVVCYRP